MKMEQKKSSKSLIRIILAIVEFILLIVVVVIAVTSFLQINSKKAAAEYFFESIMNGDYEVALQDVKSDNGALPSLTAFENAMVSMNLNDVDEYEISQGNKGKFTLEYTDTDDIDYEFKIVVEEKEKNLFLVFKQYEINIDNLYIDEVFLDVPSGLDVSLDGTPVSKDFMITEQDEFGYDQYIMDNVFPGDHVIRISGTNVKPYSEAVYFDEYSTYYYAQTPYVEDEIVGELTGICGEILSKLYGYAVVGDYDNSYAYIETLIDTDYSDTGYIYESIDNLCNSMAPTDGTYYNYLKFLNFSGTVYSTYYDEEGNLCVYMEADYDYEYSYSYLDYDYWTGMSYVEEYNDASNSYGYYDFVYKNDQWLLRELDLYPVNYFY